MINDAGSRPQPSAARDLGDLARAFLRSPLDPNSWRATLAVLLGFGVAMVSMAIVSACFSSGGSLLLVLIGIPIMGLGIES
ncbi:MAG: hypothetical protein OEX05_06075, partial [Chloroflexota bacterium]|nr:hypothetical protein [Chloroflexota bacterium]